MSEAQADRQFVRFGAFEADVQTGELRKNGVKLKFSGQPFHVLAILLERPGEVITREELQKRLWPDTFVDVERNLNTAINKIREVLGDSAETPRFIETLPRRGYRFIGELQAPIQPLVAAVAAEPVGGPNPRYVWWKIGAGVLAVLVIALAVFVVNRWHREQRIQEQSALTAVPFTALPDRAISPAFSPDGSRIAFGWNGDSTRGGKGFDLYVKALGSETLLRLTRHPSEWISAAWSPDGTQIAFHRLAGADTGIYLIPMLGGPERKLLSTRLPGGSTESSPISWSPDGKWLALADVLPEKGGVIGRYLLTMETLEPKLIPNSPNCISEDLPAFSHNGEYLAYWCVRSAFDAVLYSSLIQGGQPRIVSSFQAFPTGLTWSADDQRLIYSLHSLGVVHSDELGEVTVESGSKKKLAFAGSAMLPTVSSKGNKLAYSSVFTNLKIWRRDLVQPESPAVELIPSSRAQWDAQYSPDGKRIAFASERSGTQGVWIL